MNVATRLPLLLATTCAALVTAAVAAADDLPEPASTAERPASVAETVEAVFDWIWGLPTLYDDPNARVLQEFALKGRWQGDVVAFDSNRGSFDDSQSRRFRLGAKSQWFQDFVVHFEVDIDYHCDRAEKCDDGIYEGLTEGYLGWYRYPVFQLKLGKQSGPFTLDGSTSSKRLLALERDNISENLWFTTEYHTGASAYGEVDGWRYRVGVFSSDTRKEFGNFDAGFFLLFSVTRDFAKQLGVPELEITLDYVYNERDRGNVGTRDLSNVFSLHFRCDTGTWGVRTDLSGGLGYFSQGDLIGVTVMPFYRINRYLEVVARYTHLSSTTRDGVRLPRYENRIDDGRGGQYDEGYAGLNVYLYGNEFKVQTGLKYSQLTHRAGDEKSYKGWGFTTGVRIAW